MAYVKTKGIVIKQTVTGDADRAITVFAKNTGKVQVYAQGARRGKSKLAASTEFLCYSEYVLFKKGDKFTLYSCEAVENFYPIRENMEKLTFAAHMADIIGDMTRENQPFDVLLKLFLTALHYLAKDNTDSLLITRAFEFRALCQNGMTPYVYACVTCGNKTPDKIYFGFDKHGFLCQNCIGEAGRIREISPGCVTALGHIAFAELNKLFLFGVSQSVKNELNEIIPLYQAKCLEKNYSTLDYLNII